MNGNNKISKVYILTLQCALCKSLKMFISDFFFQRCTRISCVFCIGMRKLIYLILQCMRMESESNCKIDYSVKHTENEIRNILTPAHKLTTHLLTTDSFLALYHGYKHIQGLSESYEQ